MDSSFCVFCGYGLECEDHFFMHCPLSALLLVEIKKLWNLNTPCITSLNDLLCWGLTEGLKGKRLLAFNTVLFCFCWIVWDYRNNRIFNKKSASFVFLLNHLRSLSFFWLNVRGKLGRKLNWINWCCDPLLEVPL